MELVLWLLGVALAIAVGIPLWIYLAFGRGRGWRFAEEEAENRGILPEEWDFVFREHCLPSQCSRLHGTPPACPHSVECEICAAYVMERHWQRLTAVRPARRRIPAEAWVWVGALLGGAGSLLLGASRLAYTLAAGSAALLCTGAILRVRRILRGRAGARRRGEHTHLSPPFAAG